jgi:hypothetical protein
MIDKNNWRICNFVKYLGSTLTKDGRCTCEIKSRIAMKNAAFNKNRALLLAKWTWN